MKNRILFTLLLFGCTLIASAQTVVVRDSLLKKLNALPRVPYDTNRISVLVALAYQYSLTKPDTTYLLAQQAYEQARTLNYVFGQARAINAMGLAINGLGDYAKAIKTFNQARNLFKGLNDTIWIVGTSSNIAYAYMRQGEWQKGLVILQECYGLAKTISSPQFRWKPIILLNIGECYYNLHQLDSASLYLNQALPLAQKKKITQIGRILYLLGDVALAKNNRSQAYSFYRQSIAAFLKEDAYLGLDEVYYRLATFYQKTDQKDSTIHYARLALAYSQKSAHAESTLKISQYLAGLYAGKNDTEALRYYKIAVVAKDSLFSQDKVKQLLALSFEEKQQAREIEAAKADYRNTIRTYIFIGLLAILAVIALVQYRTNRRKQKANALLQRQRDEIHEQRTKAENALSDLRATQTQLVQREKMASLGELTAGIAHEIQNPLNFVNNFSEISAELVSELKEELDRNDTEGAKVLADDLAKNLRKITHHGGRASAIVRGMLDHSRAGTGEKRATDLNALVNEYLKIAYQGWRVKDRDFNAELITDFDSTLPQVEVMPQEIGRVLLNLYNNAFYAVREQTKNLQGLTVLTGLANYYQPTITVSTIRVNGHVEIRVGDNGVGVPKVLEAKVFQPFFTTKPTGEGTGLGLSLSYDIVTKGHQGSLLVYSQESEGTEFVIQLPGSAVSVQTPEGQIQSNQRQ